MVLNYRLIIKLMVDGLYLLGNFKIFSVNKIYTLRTERMKL